jgi:hypothetical protein
MAKKTRKQKQRAATRRPGAPATGAPATAAPAAAARPAATQAPASTRPAAAQAPSSPRPAVPRALPDTILPLPGTELEVESDQIDEAPDDEVAAAVDSSSRRRVQRLNPAAQPRPLRGQLSAAAMFQPLDSEEAAIPFDRVPYVPRDLRRVAIMAALMIVLILIAAFVVTRINP